MKFLARTTINGMSGEEVRERLAQAEEKLFGEKIASADESLERSDMINVYMRLADGDRNFIEGYRDEQPSIFNQVQANHTDMSALFDEADKQIKQMKNMTQESDEAEVVEKISEEEHDEHSESCDDEEILVDNSASEHPALNVNHKDVNSNSDNEAFQGLTQAVKESTERIEYYKVTFPMEHIGGGVFRFANGVELPFDSDGAGYMSERLPQTRYASWTSAWRDEDYEWMAEQTNRNINRLTKTYIASVWDGKIQGVMSNYNPVSHTTVLANIIDAGHENHVDYWYIDNQQLTIGVRINSAHDDKVVVGLHVVNGHSGHSALRHRLYIRSGAFEMDRRVVASRNRHLSKVNDGVQAIQSAFDAIEEVALVDYLERWTASQAIAYIGSKLKNQSTRQTELLMLAHDDDSITTALDIVALFGEYANTRGYKTGVNNMLKHLVDKAVDSQL